MTLPQIYSRRRREASGPRTDVYVYDDIPQKARVQLVHVFREATAPEWHYGSDTASNQLYTHLVAALRKEQATFHLTGHPSQHKNFFAEYYGWLLAEQNIEHLLDGIEYMFRGVDYYVRENEHVFSRTAKTSPDDAIAEANARLLENGVGYQFQNGDIIRVDSLLAHSEIVVPAINLTNDRSFATANSEYMRAHEAFRNGDHETCLIECAKAFESVLKVIGAARHWPIAETDPASKLINAAVAAGFLQPYMSAGFTALRSMLESGVPVPRNKSSGHGAGQTARVVPQELAAFQLHQTAAAIIFLIESHDAQS